MSFLGFVLFICYLYLTGTIFFDGMHYLLHRWARSEWKILRQLSRYHQYHHLYYGRLLQFNPKYTSLNARIALPLELFCQLLGSVIGWLLARAVWLSPSSHSDRRTLLLVLLIQTGRALAVIFNDGKDSNHISYNTIPKDWSWAFVGPEYHALHHHYPDKYMGSAIKVFDWVAGTAYSLRGKTAVMVDGSGEFGQAMEKHLLGERVKCVHKLSFKLGCSQQDNARLLTMLEEADILILAHDTQSIAGTEPNFTSSIQLVQEFLRFKATRRGKVLPEIWYLGCESELLLPWGIIHARKDSVPAKPSFLPYARSLYRSSQVVYRHIVLPAYHHPTTRFFASPDWVAHAVLWWIRRGAHFVPVTWTGRAYSHFLPLLFGNAVDMDWTNEGKDMRKGFPVLKKDELRCIHKRGEDCMARA
ncbi:uncharacterized protein BO95DRAFT_510697 [Aspergillus brunneoviolaceus CBS 621.78]|uniref:Uncharacterized protein n=1 Tax=Aspergillus brunneoviolaceus CBS 621.78 TaxID=1450534 RepID=A0ACD1GNJ8_9EURO|nr:hypothetical protein BO95DRAFT_510697 [Aspergillus brunneoviolaceus CBS 621.78]RAH50641.1 hypothetical protein BO95DRAFT_510697 [Aspergillus brunneoviolaceus CBS 621.78]